MASERSDELRSILERLTTGGENPVARARRLVELQVPPQRRGPGWERHWRELEAYAATPGSWTDTVDSPAAPRRSEISAPPKASAVAPAMSGERG